MRTLCFAALLLTACPAKEKSAIRVAAASDLTVAFEAMKGPFEQESGEALELIFGSSGQLSKQLVEGAPFDLFAAANEAFTDAPITAGVCDGATKAQYAEGHLVLVGAKALADLKDPKIVKIAIANPELAPYGRAAKEALTKAGLWAELEPKLVYGQNIQQTFQLLRSGNAEAALVSRSLAKDGAAIAEATPLKQFLVSCRKGEQFRAFVLGEKGRKILTEAGFGLP